MDILSVSQLFAFEFYLHLEGKLLDKLSAKTIQRSNWPIGFIYSQINSQQKIIHWNGNSVSCNPLQWTVWEGPQWSCTAVHYCILHDRSKNETVSELQPNWTSSAYCLKSCCKLNIHVCCCYYNYKPLILCTLLCTYCLHDAAIPLDKILITLLHHTTSTLNLQYNVIRVNNYLIFSGTTIPAK